MLSSRPTVGAMPRRLAPAVLALVLLVGGVVGCAESTRLPPPEPPAAGEPLFSSDEEALAAATAAYEEYLAAVDAALAEPGAANGDLELIAEGEALEEALASILTFAERGWRFEGSRRVTEARLQQVVPGHKSAFVAIYVCESVAEVDVVNSQGESVVEPTRPDLTAFEIGVEARDSEAFVVERALWSDLQFCTE